MDTFKLNIESYEKKVFVAIRMINGMCLKC